MTVNFLDHASAIPALLEGLAISFLLFNFSYLAFAGLLITLLVVLIYRHAVKPMTGATSPGATQGRAELVVSSAEYFKQLQNPKAVLITGAAQGLGYALARQYFLQKATSLKTMVMLDRDETVLKTAAAKLQEEFSATITANKISIVTEVCDVTKRQEMHDLMIKCNDLYNLDVVIANAGISPFSNTHLTFEEQCHLVTDVNAHGVLNTVLPLHNAFRRAGAHGDVKQILLISSGTGLVPIAAAPYSSTKAFVTMLGRTLRQELAAWNVSVMIANPAWIETAIAKGARDANVGTPAAMTPDGAAARMVQACDIDEGSFIDPAAKYLPVFSFAQAVGYKMWDFVAAKLKGQPKPYYADGDVSAPPQQNDAEKKKLE